MEHQEKLVIEGHMRYHHQGWFARISGGGGESDEFYGGAGYDRCDVDGREHARSHNISGCEEIF